MAPPECEINYLANEVLNQRIAWPAQKIDTTGTRDVPQMNLYLCGCSSTCYFICINMKLLSFQIPFYRNWPQIDVSVAAERRDKTPMTKCRRGISVKSWRSGSAGISHQRTSPIMVTKIGHPPPFFLTILPHCWFDLYFIIWLMLNCLCLQMIEIVEKEATCYWKVNTILGSTWCANN